MNDILEYFPLAELRPKQVKACTFIQRKVEEGFTDIVIGAPTGIGKSAIGVAAAHWIASHIPTNGCDRGAYYLVTQKLLQDQITNDIPRYKDCCSNSFSIKSSTEYECPEFGNCAIGRRSSKAAEKLMEMSAERRDRITKAIAERKAKNPDDPKAHKSKRCSCLSEGQCSYMVAKSAWLRADLSVTNYAFLFAAKTYTQDIKPRQLLVLDEAHNVPDQIIHFVDASVSLSQVKKWTNFTGIPDFKNINEYVDWIEKIYVPRLLEVYAQLEDIESLSDGLDEKTSKEVTELDSYICKLARAVAQIKEKAENWVFWKEDNRDNTDSQYIVRPIYSGPFVQELIKSVAPIRLYLSAYPGIPEIFCRDLGLDTKKVAWLNLNSDFPIENRRIHYFPTGSMGSSSKKDSLPTVLRSVVKIAKHNSTTRGLIHCTSYELGETVQAALTSADSSRPVIFPKNADERDQAFKTHSISPNSILISPSMREGFDFAGDKARWQILVKLPYPFLGDKQVARKLQLDPDWYQMKTIMDVIQACGRICRSKEDYGTTFILDGDFERLYNKNAWMLPSWFKDAIVFHTK